MEKELVLVTGGSGYIATYITMALLRQGYRVRATLRTMSRQNEVKAMLMSGGVTDIAALEFIEADLTKDKGWPEAVAGAAYVMHVASPTPATGAGESMVQTAVDGVLRVMNAAKAAGVRRVVLTSASGAVLAGHKDHPGVFTEEDWTDLTGNVNAYQRSKTLAERAAWEFAEKEKLELSTILPVAVMGPVLGKDYSHSNQMIRAMLTGKMPRLLKLAFDYIDVRDVADLHHLAMTRPEAAGERFLATANQNVSYREEAEILRRHLGDDASKVSTKEIPDFLVKLVAIFNKDVRMPATFLGQNTACSNEKAKRLLGWQPKWSAEEAIAATAKSMVELGLVD